MEYQVPITPITPKIILLDKNKSPNYRHKKMKVIFSDRMPYDIETRNKQSIERYSSVPRKRTDNITTPRILYRQPSMQCYKKIQRKERKQTK